MFTAATRFVQTVGLGEVGLSCPTSSYYFYGSTLTAFSV